MHNNKGHLNSERSGCKIHFMFVFSQFDAIETFKISSHYQQFSKEALTVSNKFNFYSRGKQNPDFSFRHFCAWLTWSNLIIWVSSEILNSWAIQNSHWKLNLGNWKLSNLSSKESSFLRSCSVLNGLSLVESNLARLGESENERFFLISGPHTNLFSTLKCKLYFSHFQVLYKFQASMCKIPIVFGGENIERRPSVCSMIVCHFSHALIDLFINPYQLLNKWNLNIL